MTNGKALYLSAKGLTKVFGLGGQKTVAVDNVDLDLYQGEVVSIVGESGSGKTTLAKMLLGLISVTEGEIYFQGAKRDISSHKKKKEYWKNIQAIFQDPFSSYNTFNKIDSVTLQREYAPYDWYDTVMVSTLNSDDITKVRFLEEWYIDESKLDIEKKIVGVAPMLEKYNEEGELRGYMPLFWIYLDDKYPITN